MVKANDLKIREIGGMVILSTCHLQSAIGVSNNKFYGALRSEHMRTDKNTGFVHS